VSVSGLKESKGFKLTRREFIKLSLATMILGSSISLFKKVKALP